MRISISPRIILTITLLGATFSTANIMAMKAGDETKEAMQQNVQNQPENPTIWLNKICKEAAVAPKPDHTDLSIKLGILPDKNDLKITLKQFSEKTIGALEQECKQPYNAATDAEKKRVQDLKTAIENFTQHASNDCQNASQLKNLDALTSLAYVRKLILKPGDEIYCVGDIHGCIGSLVRNIWIWRCIGLLDDNFKVAKGKYILFLGDYVDYGSNSISVLYTLLKLKLHNWDQIILCRGNHESAAMSSQFKFLQTMQTSYPEEGQSLWASCAINCCNILPFAVYIGVEGNNKFIQCCHGGLEPGYNPKDFLASPSYFESLQNTFNDYAFFDPCFVNELNKVVTQYPANYSAIFLNVYRWIMSNLNNTAIIDQTMTQEEQDKATINRLGIKGSYQLKNYAQSGFLWSDFNNSSDFWFNQRGVGFMCTQKFFNNLQQPIAAIIRGHQHNVGIKIGALQQNENLNRWFNVLKIEAPQALPKPTELVQLSSAAKAFNKLPFRLEFSTPHVQEACDTNRWESFVNHLPHFKLSDNPLKNNVPIITLTTATEAWPQPPIPSGVANIWDAFGILTLDKNILDSEIAIYEAEAKTKEEKQAEPVHKP